MKTVECSRDDEQLDEFEGADEQKRAEYNYVVHELLDDEVYQCAEQIVRDLRGEDGGVGFKHILKLEDDGGGKSVTLDIEMPGHRFRENADNICCFDFERDYDKYIAELPADYKEALELWAARIGAALDAHIERYNLPKIETRRSKRQ